MTASATAFEASRPRLLGIAYGMLGELAEAEDVVQDAWLRFADAEGVRNSEAFLVTVTTRLAIDRLRSARIRRESYVGAWLPDPLVTDPETPEAVAIEAEQLSQALLFALERLNPVERAVLLLRDVFDLDYAEIADAVDKAPDNVRQIAARARAHAGDTSRHRPVDRREADRIARAFARAATAGDVDGLRELLAADAILWSDGGGVAVAARRPILGADRIARFFTGIRAKAPADPSLTPVLVNGAPGWRVSAGGEFVALFSLDLDDGRVVGVRSFRNPDRFA